MYRGVPFRVLGALWRLTPRTVSLFPRTRRRLCLASPLSSTMKTLRAEKFLALASASRLPARLSRWSSLSRDAGGLYPPRR